MESAVTALVTGALALVGVLMSNSRSRAVMEVKIDNLTRKAEKHNCLIERACALEQDVAVVKAEIENKRKGRLCWGCSLYCAFATPTQRL